ncbi:MAG: hypothetical protein LCH70_11430 [Proteobacteria bacterium]|nr:hypothetical protein [Pseudomonadota bacterium]
MTQEPADGGGKGPGSAFDLRFEMRDGSLCVYSSGTVDSLPATIEFFLRIGEELGRVQARRVLIVDSTDGVVPSAQEFETLATSIRDAGFDGVRVAYVDVKGTAVGRIEVGEIVARRHGYHFRVFDREPLAWLWLRYGRE